MKTRVLLAGGLAAGVSLALAGCTAPADSPGAVATSLTMWHNSADSPALLQLYKDFEEETGIAIELVDVPSDSFETTTLTKWATGDRPDLLEFHPTIANMLTLNPAQNMQDLSDMDFVAASGDLYESMGSLDGKVYAAVTGFPSIFGIYYNKAVFADNGLEPPRSFDDLADLCTALAPSGVAPIWESGGSVWPTQVLPLLYVADHNAANAYGADVGANKAALDDADSPFLAGLEAYAGLRDGGCFNADATSATFEDGLKAVYAGTAAMTALHSDTYASLLADAGDSPEALDAAVGFVPVSSTSPVASWAGGPLGTYYAPKTGDAAKEKAARDFIAYATGAGYQKLVDDGKSFPVIDTAKTPEGFSALQLSFQSAYEDDSSIAFNSNVAGFGALATETSKLLAAQTTPKDAARTVQAAVEQASTAAGLPGW
ncbi:MAG: carbohydrate ABC transporter substrate-binding protein [Microbacterium sp.]|nr:carbohydrate ABC transporter substrate-binding protein [Microbacterium sp.]